MSNQTIISARTHLAFNEVFHELMANRLWVEISKPDFRTELDREQLDKAVWLASIIATSEDENDKYIASVFGILLFLEFKESIDYQKAAYLILSRSGNLIASRFFDQLVQAGNSQLPLQFIRSFGASLDFELGGKAALNQISENGISFLCSDYQKRLWKALLADEQNIAISAPTSAGKSFIIQNFLRHKFTQEDRFFVVYLVPTRALISQVSAKFKTILPADVKVNTAFVEKDGDEPQFGNKEIFVLTPERCMKLMQYSYTNLLTPNLLFIDEVQNIEHNDGRGFLFEFLINEVLVVWGGVRTLIAGPFLEDPQILFRLIFNRESNQLQTLFSPVFQLKVSIHPSEEDSNSILARIHFQGSSVKEVQIPVEFDYGRAIQNKSKTLIRLVGLFGNNSKNIIYFPKSNYAERYAVQLADNIVENLGNAELDQRVRDLIGLVEEEIHPQYYLIDALRAKTAFHHGKLPEIIRGELEDLFIAGHLQNVVCTSTLMEGVNLPAEKVFVAHPRKDNIPLSPLEFSNIVGRAGRVGDTLVGTVLCIENTEEPWAETNFSNDQTQEIIPAINKVLSTPIDEIADAIRLPLDDIPKELNAAVCFLKHKFLQGDQILDDYLSRKNLDEASRNAIIDTISQRLGNLEIPADLVRLNPSIDPEIQNALYVRIRTDGISEWVIHENSNLFNWYISKEQRANLSRTEDNLYGQFESIVLKLNEIFDFNREAYFKHQISRSVKQMVLYGIRWIRNENMSALIRSDINWYANIRQQLDKTNRSEVNRKINEVIKVYSTIVSFVLVKYLKLLADMLDAQFNDEQKEAYKLTLNLPTYLELGTLNVAVLQLISQGMSRSVAIKVGPLVPDNRREDAGTWLKEQTSLNVSPIYLRYLKRKGFIGVAEEQTNQTE